MVVVVQGPHAGSRVVISNARAFTIGRGPTGDLRLEDDSGTSRVHLEIVLKEGVVRVRDLNATQGTFLGSTRLEPQRSAVWDPDTMLRVGERTVLELRMPEWVRAQTQDFIRARRGASADASPPESEPRDEPTDAPAAAAPSDPAVRVEGGTSAAIAEIHGAELEPAVRRSPGPWKSTPERIVAALAAALVVLAILFLYWIFR
jgi:hypothetical protein